jgi:serine/threonine-protein kinase
MASAHPERLGKYRIEGVLGEGAMGVVYRGFDPGIGRQVALKTIRHALLEGAETGAVVAARFRNEAQAAGRLMHPGIVGVYDYGDEGDIAYIAMEFVDGSSLSRVLASDTRFGEDDTLSVMAQLLDALEHAHGNGVLHRDVKPGNLLLTADGRLKIADFGIARIDSVALTQASFIVGTPGYMAPEQFLGREIDRRVDVYAAGVLLYQLLAGTPPFTGNPAALMYKVVNEAPVLPSALPGLERLARYDRVVERALAKEPDARYATARDFKQALLAAAARPAQPTLSGAAVATVMSMRKATPAPPPSSAAHWDPAVLAQVETMLAQHVGPLASVLVRRAARECADLQALHVKLAEGITNPAARSAFVAQVSTSRSGGVSAKPVGSAPPAGTPPAGSALVDEALVTQCARLLAKYLGPIATVVARRAAAQAEGRATFFTALTEAVGDADQRAKLRAELDRLP